MNQSGIKELVDELVTISRIVTNISERNLIYGAINKAKKLLEVKYENVNLLVFYHYNNSSMNGFRSFPLCSRTFPSRKELIYACNVDLTNNIKSADFFTKVEVMNIVRLSKEELDLYIK